MGLFGAPQWTEADAPDQTGRTVLITGANSGLGFCNAVQLASRGATVLMACRSPERAEAAQRALEERVPDAQTELVQLDLADLASVRAAAEQVARDHDKLDLLINNAGVMALPRRTTSDGFEMQLGTNHLGHFALTGLLFPLLEAAGGRVTSVSSLAHYMGWLNWDDLMGERRYQPWLAYGQSKLANLLFTFGLNRRARERGVTATAAHPGYADTNLQHVAPQMTGNPLTRLVMAVGNGSSAQSAEMGALPTLYAAVHPELSGGEFVGPGFLEYRGYPEPVGCASRARDEAAQDRLWQVSEELTGVRF